MSIFNSIEGDFERLWDNHIKPVIQADIEPALKSFVKQFDSSFGGQALKAALAGVAALEIGTPFATVASGLATTLFNDAKNDASSAGVVSAQEILQTVQSALQVAKAANNIVTPADQNTVAALSSGQAVS